MLSADTLSSVIMLCVIIFYAILLSFIMLNAITISVVLLNAIWLSGFMLNVTKLSDVRAITIYFNRITILMKRIGENNDSKIEIRILD
jgi:hypothetical protein